MNFFEKILNRCWALLASILVNPRYYLDRYPDVAASGIDPKIHFARYWHKEPVRAPNSSIESFIFKASPIVVLVLYILRRDRQDWMDCLRYRINELSCTDSVWRYRISLAVARFVGFRLNKRPSRLNNFHAGGLGRSVSVLKAGKDPSHGINLTIIEPESRYTFVEPKAFDDLRAAKHREIDLPALTITSVENASIFGFFQVMAAGSLLLYEPAAEPSFRFVARQCEFVIGHLPSSRRSLLARVPNQADQFIREAVLLGGRCGENYFHFLIEYLTRGYTIEKVRQLDNLPLIVSDELFPQEFEAIDIIFPGRKIIRRKHASRVDVQQLHIPALMTYLPDSAEIEFWKTAAVNKEALAWLRDRVLRHLTTVHEKSKLPDRIYIPRKGARVVTNSAEIDAIYIEFGFTIVDPTRLSFIDQVRLFSSASIVSGPMGAAFSNIVFARPETKILMIASPFMVRFPIFASLADFVGCPYYVMPGERKDYLPGMEDDRQALVVTHSDYEVDPTRLRRFLSRLAVDA